MDHVFVLPVPWAHYDTTWRRKLDRQNACEIAAGTPIYLAIPSDIDVEISGYKMGVHTEGESYPLGGTTYRHVTSSIGTRPEEDMIEVSCSATSLGWIKLRGHMPRPGWTARREGGAPQSLLAEELDHFLLGLIDLIRFADDPELQHCQSGWERLSSAWYDGRSDPTEPPMALIVRHAEEMQHPLVELVKHPRRILRRFRSMTPVDRVQQVDVSCIQWLTRQPGTTIYERAGPRQRILSVQRYENQDTLENRVLRDFCHRSSGVAASYVKRHIRFENSARWSLVERYGRSCARHARELAEQGISALHPPIIPNYALLQDPRYRRLWVAYIELLRRLDEEDECWRWQHRLWSDFCRLALQIALRRSAEDGGLVAESPLRLLSEQRRGQWSVVDEQSAVYRLEAGDAGPVVVSFLWDPASKHPKLPAGLAGLGAASVLHVQSLKNRREAYVLLWPVHFFGSEVPSLDVLVRSAFQALTSCTGHLRLTEDIDLTVGGLVIQSAVADGNTNGNGRAAHSPGREVIGLRLATAPEQLTTELTRISHAFSALLERLLQG